MKTALKILATALVAMFFASCSQQAIYHDGSGNAVTATQYVSSAKGGKAVAQEYISVAPVAQVAQKSCGKCGSSFCPKPDCCGVVSKAVLSRATAQGGSGEPHIGLIPTMKTLAP